MIWYRRIRCCRPIEMLVDCQAATHPPPCPPLLVQFGTATAGSDTTTWLTAWAAGGSLFSTSAANGSLCHPVAEQLLEQSIGFGPAYPSASGKCRSLLLNGWEIRTVDRLVSSNPEQKIVEYIRIDDKHAMFLESDQRMMDGSPNRVQSPQSLAVNAWKEGSSKRSREESQNRRP